MSDVLYRIQFANDQLAFKELYEKKFFKLFQFALAFVKSQLIAEELVNDIFLKLWNKRDKLDAIGNIDVYLYVAVKNASLNFLRRPEKKHVSLDEIEIEYLHISADPASVLITSELKKIIEKAINSLPPRCRLVFKLIKEDKLSYKEVAAILNVSVKTVDTQLSIALKKLEGILSPVLDAPVTTTRAKS
ncbi:MAG TPA: RNA polymerase sigma-70 factor [Puia sp.]|nr:RNA polymerase sigma-70 factor [Puia sp.]